MEKRAMIFSRHCDEGAMPLKIIARRNPMKMQRGAQTRTCDFFVIARKRKGGTKAACLRLFLLVVLSCKKFQLQQHTLHVELRLEAVLFPRADHAEDSALEKIFVCFRVLFCPAKRFEYDDLRC